MALTQELPAQIATDCMGAFTFAAPVAAASIAPVALHHKDGCAEKAQKAVSIAIRSHPEFAQVHQTRINSPLNDAIPPVSIETDVPLAATKSGTLEAEVVPHFLPPPSPCLTLLIWPTATPRPQPCGKTASKPSAQMIDFGKIVYLDVQKTGSSFVARFLGECTTLPERSRHRHAPAKALRPDAFYFTTVRAPLSQYISLFQYGLQGRGGMVERFREAGMAE